MSLHAILYGEFRRAAHVWRFSSLPVIKQENVAEHSFWTALIGMAIACEIGREELTGEVAQRAILHDIEEVGTGDLVREMKYFDPELRASIRKVEVQFAAALFDKLGPPAGRHFEHIWENAKDGTLPGRIVALADLLCVLAYCHSERKMGNTGLGRIERDCSDLVYKKFHKDPDLKRIALDAVLRRQMEFRAEVTS